MPNLNVGHAIEELAEIGESFSATSKVKIFAGYAGWAPNQLEGELKRNAWLVHPASLELVFDTPAEQLWPIVLRRIGGWRNKLLSTQPEDPSLN